MKGKSHIIILVVIILLVLLAVYIIYKNRNLLTTNKGGTPPAPPPTPEQKAKVNATVFPLHKGSHNTEVKNLQIVLNKTNDFGPAISDTGKIGEDGIFGSQTESALVATFNTKEFTQDQYDKYITGYLNASGNPVVPEDVKPTEDKSVMTRAMTGDWTSFFEGLFSGFSGGGRIH